MHHSPDVQSRSANSIYVTGVFSFLGGIITRMRSRTAWLSPLPITAIILSIGAVEKEWELNPRQTNYELVALPTELSSTRQLTIYGFVYTLQFQPQCTGQAY